MEPFFDGGLFELLFAAAFIGAANFILAKKYMIYIYSVLALAAPVLLLFFHSGEWIYWLCFICFFNSIFLVVLLWKTRKEKQGRPFIEFNLREAWNKFFSKKQDNGNVNDSGKIIGAAISDNVGL